MVYDSVLLPLASSHLSGSLEANPVGLSSPIDLLWFIETEARRREFLGVAAFFWSLDHASDVRLRPTALVGHFSIDTDSVHRSRLEIIARCGCFNWEVVSSRHQKFLFFICFILFI